MAGKSMQPSYRLVFRAEPGSVEAAIRVRRLLKIAKRSLGLTCVSAEEVPPVPAGEQARPDGMEGRAQR